MALIVYAEGQQRSGSLGATVYSHNRFGQYMRARSIPVNPNTDRQVAVRNAVRALTIAWQNTLSQAQRDAWDVYAANVSWFNKVGQAVFLTGIQHYIRSNTQLVVTFAAQQNTAPNIMNLAAAERSLTGTASEATQQITIGFDNTAGWANEDGGYQFFYGGLPKNGSIKFFGGPYRIIAAAAGAAAGAPVSPAVVPYPFPFAENNRLWLRSRILRADGRLSQFAQLNFLAAA